MNQNKFVCKPSEKLKVFIPINLPNLVKDIQLIKSNIDKKYDSSNLLLSNQNLNVKSEEKHTKSKSNENNDIKVSKNFLSIDFKHVKHDLKVFIKSLEYDSRVKKYNQNGNEITIDFHNINSSISFYKQYLCCYDMKFINNLSLDWIDDFNRKGEEILLQKSTFFSNLQPFKIVINANDKNSRYNEILKANLNENKDLFNQKVKYYASICKFFTSFEIKKMQIDIENKCYDFAFQFTKELSVGIYTNVFFQEIVQNLTQKQCFIIVNNLSYDIAPISSTKYGAYVVQTIINKCKDKNLQTMVKKYMKPFMVELLQHQIGNYSAQLILNFDEIFVLNFFCKNAVDLLNNDLSFKVFKKCYPLFKSNKIEIDKKINDVYTYLNKNRQVEIEAFLQEYSNKIDE